MKTVTRYETADGKHFKSEKLALQHEKSEIAKRLHDLFNDKWLEEHNLTHTQRYAFIERLAYGEQLKDIVEMMNNTLNYQDEEW